MITSKQKRVYRTKQVRNPKPKANRTDQNERGCLSSRRRRVPPFINSRVFSGSVSEILPTILLRRHPLPHRLLLLRPRIHRRSCRRCCPCRPSWIRACRRGEEKGISIEVQLRPITCENDRYLSVSKESRKRAGRGPARGGRSASRTVGRGELKSPRPSSTLTRYRAEAKNTTS